MDPPSHARIAHEPSVIAAGAWCQIGAQICWWALIVALKLELIIRRKTNESVLEELKLVIDDGSIHKRDGHAVIEAS